MRCNETELDIIIPKNAKLVTARNRITEQVFGLHQVNQFYSYGNVISIRCNPGYLFNDRTTEKQVSCELAPGSNTIGEYRGYSGTVLPLPTECQGELDKFLCYVKVVRNHAFIFIYFRATSRKTTTLNLIVGA